MQTFKEKQDTNMNAPAELQADFKNRWKMDLSNKAVLNIKHIIVFSHCLVCNSPADKGSDRTVGMCVKGGGSLFPN